MKNHSEWHRVRDRIRVTYRFWFRVRVTVGLIFTFILQMAYLIYRCLVDGTKYKSHLGKK